MNKFPYKIIDLTHTLNEKTPSWDGGCGFNPTTHIDYEDCKTDVKFKVQKIKMYAGIGTHIDSPAHCIPNGNKVCAIPLDTLVAPILIVDVNEKISPKYKISPEDINDFENKYGKIQENSFVAFYTGWSQHWQEREKYHNNHIFPSVSKEAAEILISRDVVGIGIDTLSPDIPSSGFPVHRIVLGSGKYIVENIANLEKIPKIGAYVVILPIKAEELSEAPVRMIGLC